MNKAEILIVGGGIAGLAAAIAMARNGHGVSVCEKAATFDPIGAGLQLGPNAVRALQALEAWDEVEPITYAPPAIHIRDGVSGKRIKELTLGKSFESRFGQPYRVAHRADLHSALLRVVKNLNGITISMGQDIDLARIDNSNPTIFADGIWSSAREHFFPGSAAITLPEKIFRSLVPCPTIGDINMQCVNLWLYPGGHVVHYPVGADLNLNLVVVTQGLPPQQHFANAAKSLQEILHAANSFTQWPAAYVPPLRQWNSGPCLLIGDAAHGTVPYLAQGAAMALEDAAALMPLSSDSWLHSFQTLASRRALRAERLHKTSMVQRKIYHAAGPMRLATKAAMKILPEAAQWSRLNWLYKT
jgi:2-polyprenyl-6-methoxyphenol hydroxylase-like FAD-dependent oxidoreductase